MKKINVFTVLAFALTATLWASSCKKDLLNLTDTTNVPAQVFWQTEADANTAVLGAYAAAREVFDRDYYFDGFADFTYVRGTQSVLANSPYSAGNYTPQGFGNQWDNYFTGLYGAVHRTNYVIENVNKMIPNAASAASKTALETIVAEARMLRGMVYFRLISMWGDVPYFSYVMLKQTDADSLKRMPIAQIRDSILADFDFAVEKLPVKPVVFWRASKPAALAFRGKLNLYWGSWKKYGWPELEGFTQDAAEATRAFTAAEADLRSVANDFGLALYKNGDPGEIDTLGKADKLPNYFWLFTPRANGDPEIIMSFTHGGGVGTTLGESLMRDFGSRDQEFAQTWVTPRYELADRYQLLSTGDFAPKLIPTPATASGARTRLNSAVNPKSYEGRDYRMKSTLLWDYEMIMGMSALLETGFNPFVYQSNNAQITINGVKWKTVNTTAVTGYLFRKFVRNYSGLGRQEGDYAWPSMRLADVYLMYAEAANEVNNGPNAMAIQFVNKVRARGKLPELPAAKISGYQEFFSAIEQERIVELVAEGQRFFDVKRWRKVESIWGPTAGPGLWFIDTWGANKQRYFQNATELDQQRYYIFRIPESERNRNKNLTQNIPWR